MDNTIEHEEAWSSRPWRIAAWSAAAALMLVPISVQLLSGNFGWSPGDFILVAIVLLTGCALFDLAARKAPNFAYLAGSAAALAAGFGLFMVNGAVGLVGSEDEGANLLFGLVILVATIGAVAARGRPERLATTMFAAAALQVVVSIAVIGLVGLGADEGAPLAEVIGLSMFAGLWAVSGGLFLKSDR